MKKSFTQFIGGGKLSLAPILLFFIALLPVKSWAETYTGESGLEFEYFVSDGEVTIDEISTAPSNGKVVIPDKIEGNPVTIIAEGAFANQPGIISVEIPASVKLMGGRVFYGCNNLSQVSFAEGSQLTSIENRSFSETKIKEITIPEKVTYIGIFAFGGNENGISTVTFLSRTPCELGQNWFGGSISDDFTIIVPAGCADIYKPYSYMWGSVAKYIKEAEPSAIKDINAPTGTSTAHAAIYTLDGKLVSKDGNTQSLTKGVYVQNGKKVVIGK